MPKYIYLQDDQMYYTTPIIFKTKEKIDAELMRKLSWEPVVAGRISTSFETFQAIMRTYGLKIKEVKRLAKNAEIPEKYKYKTVIGATGNY